MAIWEVCEYLTASRDNEAIKFMMLQAVFTLQLWVPMKLISEQKSNSMIRDCSLLSALGILSWRKNLFLMLSCNKPRGQYKEQYTGSPCNLHGAFVQLIMHSAPTELRALSTKLMPHANYKDFLCIILYWFDVFRPESAKWRCWCVVSEDHCIHV